MTTAWAHLPNARHIDAVLADVKARPGVWAKALSAALGIPPIAPQATLWGRAIHTIRKLLRVVPGRDERVTAWVESRCEIWGIVKGTPQFSNLHTVRIAADTAAIGSAWAASWDAILALVVWDSSADLLDLSPDALRTLIDIAPAPVCHQAALLLPWAIVREQQP